MALQGRWPSKTVTANDRFYCISIYDLGSILKLNVQPGLLDRGKNVYKFCDELMMMTNQYCCMTDRMHVSTYAWWNSFKPIAFVL